MSADDKMVDVQFFGDHTFETVPVDNCLIYSEQHPEKETFQFRSDFEDAQEVRGMFQLNSGAFIFSAQNVFIWCTYLVCFLISV